MIIPKKREPRGTMAKAASEALEKAILERRKSSKELREERNKRLRDSFKSLK